MKTWEEYYIEAENYYKINGNLLVPINYCCGNNIALGRWISTQRQKYKGNSKCTLSNEQISKLEKIGMIWNPVDYLWMSSYFEAKKYYELKGNLIVPRNFTQNNVNISQWIKRQRQKYHGNLKEKLTKEQIDLLIKIGMVWDEKEYNWNNYIFEAKKYVESNSNLDVPQNYITKNNIHLGSWISHLRRDYNRGLLSDKKINQLNSLGMIWSSYEHSFSSGLFHSKEYFMENGDLLVPYSYICNDGYALGRWIGKVRSLYKKKKLSNENIKKLESLGMVWRVDYIAKQTSYAEQVVYYYIKKYFNDAINRYDEFGFELDIYIPSLNIGIEYDGENWHKNLKKDIRKNNDCAKHNITLIRMREEKCPKIDNGSINFNVGKYNIENLLKCIEKVIIHVYEIIGKNENVYLDYYKDVSNIQKQYKNAINQIWESQYLEAKKYFEKHGNLRVPHSYVSETGFKLGIWINNLRENYRGYSGTGISRERIERLSNIGMIWNPFDYNWENGYLYAFEYYKKYGDLIIKEDRIKELDFNLDVWIHRQRNEYKNGKLSKERIIKLEKIRINWDPFVEQWEKGYLYASEYYKNNGDLLVKSDYKVDNFSLGSWIKTQRRRYAEKNNEKKLTKEQIDRLNNIGMIWNIIDYQWDIGYKQAVKYYTKNGNLYVPLRFIDEDGYNLGVWIHDKRCARNNIAAYGELTKEQIEKLNSIGMIWNALEYEWNRNYKIAKNYFLNNGNLNIPKRYVTKEGENIGYWIQRQRLKYLRNQLEKEKIEKLNKIGIIWKYK